MGATPPQIQDTGNLIDQAKKGDQQAWESMVARHQRELYGMIRVRSRDDSEARDILQDTWLKVFQSLSNYDASRPFIAFLKQNALWKLLDRYRTNAARREVLFAELQSFNQKGDPERDPAEWFASDAPEPLENPLFSDDIYVELLKLTFALPLPPHQLISFGFCKLLERKPQTVAEECSERLLDQLGSQLQEIYGDETDVPRETLNLCFQPLHRNLRRQLAEVCEPPTRVIYPQLLERIVGRTLLREYYTTEPTENIRQWWYAVQRRVWSTVKALGHGVLFDLLAAERCRRAARKEDSALNGGKCHG